jgi:hypothetical protein
MDQLEIINAIKDLPAAARLAVAEATLQSLREELPPPLSTLEEKRGRLAEAARIALPYYLSDPELTIFTALDGEDFYEYGEG